MKRCGKCEIEKPRSEFYKRNDRRSLSSYCKQCKRNYSSQYYKKNKNKIIKRQIEYIKKRSAFDENYKLRTIIRKEMCSALNHNVFKGLRSDIESKYGCDIDFLRDYIECKFYKNPISGIYMNWNNWGYLTTGHWQIDHIMPLSDFDLTDPEQYIRASHYSNIQPLWYCDHINKHKGA